jgi:hypothetical protein
MAHYIFELNGHTLRLHDVDIALLKHFIEVGAKRTSNRTIIDSLGRWEWAGPGIWLNVDELVLRSNAGVLSAAEAEIVSLGEQVSVEYIGANVPCLTEPSGRSAAALLCELHKLKVFLESGA